jgi:RND family efflux transporter MFP subunit
MAIPPGLDDVTPEARPRGGRERRGRVVTIVGVAILGLAVLLAIGIIPRMQRRAELANEVRAATTNVPLVNVITPTPGSRTADLTLPGSIQAIQETPLYSRVDGYLKKRNVDIGDRVQSGQVLAEIDTPDLDQQLAQARAALAQSEAGLTQARSALQQSKATLQHSRATMEYSRGNLNRWRELKAKNLVAQQDVDDRQMAFDASQADTDAALANVEALQANIVAAQANVDANKANVQRLTETQSFQRVRAPFAGVITQRTVEQGSLINSGSSSTFTPMFRLAQTDSLRIFVNVPQTFMTSITPGMTVQLLIREFPQKVFNGQVVNISGALDQASRTLLTEIRMKNDGDLLRPGMYADARLHIERDSPPLLIPTSALIIRAGGPRVAIVGPDQKIRFQLVDLGRDYGATVEVIRGISPRDRLVNSPPDGLVDGSAVRIAKAVTTTPPTPAGSAPAPAPAAPGAPAGGQRK